MLTNCGVNVVFPVYDQFGAIQKSDSGRMVSKPYIFISSKFVILQHLQTELKHL